MTDISHNGNENLTTIGSEPIAIVRAFASALLDLLTTYDNVTASLRAPARGDIGLAADSCNAAEQCHPAQPRCIAAPDFDAEILAHFRDAAELVDSELERAERDTRYKDLVLRWAALDLAGAARTANR